MAAQGRCNQIAALKHFTRNLGISSLIRPDERKVAQSVNIEDDDGWKQCESERRQALKIASILSAPK